MANFILHPKLAADSSPLGHLPLCEIRLSSNALFPWLLLIPQQADLRELIDLAPASRHRLTDEITDASEVLRDVFSPTKINVASLGNQVPQLHLHVIARFDHDPAWPGAVWGGASAPYAPGAREERTALIQKAFAKVPGFY